jgi:putative DNA primase/helicase
VIEPDPLLVVPPVPERPTADDVAAARGWILDDLFVDFCFVTEGDRAHAVCGLLTPFVRRMIEGCAPLHVVEAPEKGTGKSLLAKLIYQIVAGSAAPLRTLPDNDEEVRKFVTSELLAGRPIIVLDNAVSRIESVQLTTLLTSDVWQDRELGRNRNLSLRNQALWMLTGNNPDLSDEMARRSVRIRIDAKTDRPHRRKGFKHHPIERWTRQHRSQLVHAVLVLVQAWTAAGCPASQETLGSFDGWAATIGGILEVAGIPGFLANQDEMLESADQRHQGLREFIAIWANIHGTNTVSVSELCTLCNRFSLLGPQLGDGSEKSQSIKLGRILHAQRDRVVGDYRVEHVPEQARRSMYRLQRVAESTSTPAALPSPAEVDPWDED